jgi:hypothetical protein
MATAGLVIVTFGLVTLITIGSTILINRWERRQPRK